MDCFVIRISRLPFDAPSRSWRLFYRDFSPMRYRFSVKNRCKNGLFSESAIFLRDKDFTLSGVIRLADDAFEFHSLHQ